MNIYEHQECTLIFLTFSPRQTVDRMADKSMGDGRVSLLFADDTKIVQRKDPTAGYGEMAVRDFRDANEWCSVQ